VYRLIVACVSAFVAFLDEACVENAPFVIRGLSFL
jgi:hypothetical protein